MRSAFIAAALAILTVTAVAGGPTKYRVTTRHDKHTDFARLKTYAWQPGWEAHDRTAHDQIVTAVDRELAALGFTKAETGPSDVVVSYATVRRTDVDLKTHAPEGQRPTYPVATLIVLLRDPGSHKELFRGRADTPVQLDADLGATITDQIGQMFARYPTRNH